jgi:hypothetical protein
MENVDHIEYRTGENSVYNNSLALLPYQFQGSENIIKLIYVISEMTQRLDDVVVDFAKLRLINSAFGFQLDNIGKEVGVDRLGATDDDYRVILKIRAFRRTSQGTRPQIVDLLSRFTGTLETDVDVYVGSGKTTDIYFNEGCSNIQSMSSEILKILPILTNYRLVSKVGEHPFGFISVFNETEETNFLGFSSVFDDPAYGGTGGSLISASV